jgi:polysaccharide export outer membrane protein
MFELIRPLLIGTLIGIGSLLNAAELEPADYAVYLLSPFDKITISVYGQEDLKSEQRISDQGAVSMPLLGNLTIGGLPVFEAQKLIEVALVEQRYLVKPVVTISIDQFSPKFITVLGEVDRPGSIEIPQGRNGLPIQIAIAEAGGFTGAAHTSEVSVTRDNADGGGDVEKSIKVDVSSILRSAKAGETKDFFLSLPDDIIFVPRRLF